MVNNQKIEKKIKASMVVFILYGICVNMCSQIKVFPDNLGVIASVICFAIFLYCFVGSQELHRLRIDKTNGCFLLFCIVWAVLLIVTRSYSGVFVAFGLFLMLSLIRMENLGLDHFALKFFMFVCIFFCVGILFEYFFTGLYNQVFLPLFVQERQARILAWQTEGRFCGFSYQAGDAAKYMVYGIGCLLYLKREKKVKDYVALAIFFFALFLTGKRTLFLVAIFLPFFVNMITEKVGIKKILIFTLIVILALGGYFFILNRAETLISYGGLLGHFAKTFMSDSLETLLGIRSKIWTDSWNAFLSNPIFGMGAISFEKTYSSTGYASHNAFLQLLSQGGIVCFIPWLLFLMSFISDITRKAKTSGKFPEAKMALFFIFQFFINSITETTMNSDLSTMGIAILVSSFAINEAIKRSTQDLV